MNIMQLAYYLPNTGLVSEMLGISSSFFFHETIDFVHTFFIDIRKELIVVIF